jgi:hypothetical protein
MKLPGFPPAAAILRLGNKVRCFIEKKWSSAGFSDTTSSSDPSRVRSVFPDAFLSFCGVIFSQIFRSRSTHRKFRGPADQLLP